MHSMQLVPFFEFPQEPLVRKTYFFFYFPLRRSKIKFKLDIQVISDARTSGYVHGGNFAELNDG
jgi:hypothetical protein